MSTSSEPARDPHHDMIGAGLALAHDARVLVAISFHYNPERLSYLFEVLTSLSDFNTKSLHVVVLTNTVDSTQVGVLDAVGRALFKENDQFLVVSCAGLAHPYDLTWAHKIMIRNGFAEGSEYSHFIYLEDDLRLTLSGFSYFLSAREILRPHGLIPGFVRYEYRPDCDGVLVTDQRWRNALDGRPRLDASGVSFLQPDSPYQAMYILDRDLAAEYLTTRSFDRDESVSVMPWGVRERSAMGLAFENPPPPFTRRYVIPVDSGNKPLRCAWIHHMPNTYALNRSPENIFCTVKMGEFFG